MIEWFGDVPVVSITRAQVSEFREALQALPKLRNKVPTLTAPMKKIIARTKTDENVAKLTPATVGKHMRHLTSFFGWAQEQGYVSDKVASGVYKAPKRKRAANEERNAWTPEQLQMLLASPFYKGCQSKSRRGDPGSILIKDQFYWVPLLCLYHPCRPEEIAQLFVEDIHNQNGIDCIYIDGGLDQIEADIAGKQIKSLSARRSVPIHRRVINAGFLKYVADIKEAGHKRLFPDLKRGGTDGRFSNYFLKQFNMHIRTFGIHGVSFYGFRHTVVTALSERHPNTDINDELAGHAIGGQRGRYRKGASLSALKKAIDSISYNEIDALISQKE